MAVLEECCCWTYPVSRTGAMVGYRICLAMCSSRRLDRLRRVGSIAWCGEGRFVDAKTKTLEKESTTLPALE